jgi:hypothetical protein
VAIGFYISNPADFASFKERILLMSKQDFCPISVYEMTPSVDLHVSQTIEDDFELL